METGDLSCALSGKPLSGMEAIFLTSSPDNFLIADLNKELPGKHVCLECRKDVITQAITQGILHSALSQDLKIQADFTDKAYSLLRKKAYNMLCLAKKSGLLVFGFEKVTAALKSGEVDFILQASDGMPDGKHKSTLNAGGLRIFGVFTSGELGKVVGRKRIVHTAILKGNVNISEIIVSAIRRIENF